MKRNRKNGLKGINPLDYLNALAIYGEELEKNKTKLDIERPRCSCGKIMYDSEKAVEVAKNRKRKELGIKSKIYRCELCGYFHLASL